MTVEQLIDLLKTENPTLTATIEVEDNFYLDVNAIKEVDDILVIYQDPALLEQPSY